MTLRGFDAVPGQLSGNLVFTIPATAQVGDFVLVQVYTEGNGQGPTITLPSGEGYTQIGSRFTNTGTNPDFHTDLYYKRVESGDAGSDHSFAVSSNWRAGLMACYTNPLASGDPNDATPTVSTSTSASTSHVAPTITPATQPHLEIVVDQFFGGNAATPPSPMTEVAEGENIYQCYLYRTTTTSPGTRTVTGPNNRFKAIHLLIKEAAAPPAEITGTGAVTINEPALAGTGAFATTASGAVAIGAPSLAASGSVVHNVGVGAVTVSTPVLEGAGAVVPRAVALVGAFETSDTSEFDQTNVQSQTATDATLAVVSSPTPASGTYALETVVPSGQNTGSGGFSRVLWDDGDTPPHIWWDEQTEVWYSASFYFPSGFLAAHTTQLDILRWDTFGPANASRGGLVIFGSDHKLYLMRLQAGVESQTTILGPFDVIAEDTWLHLEVRQVFSETDGQAVNEVWVNGTQVGSNTAKNFYGDPINRLRVGQVAMTQAAAQTVYVDAVRVSTERVGPPAATISGDGAIALAAPTFSGSGAFATTGSGAIAIGAPALVGAGTLATTGAGAVALGPPIVAGTGAFAVTGSGALSLAAPSLAGAGLVVAPGSGSGGIVVGAPSLAGVGTFATTGSGAVEIGRPVLSGSGAGSGEEAPMIHALMLTLGAG